VKAGLVASAAERLAAGGDGSAATVAGAGLEQHALRLPPGSTLHRCGDRAETLFVVGGRGRLRLPGEEHRLEAGTGVFLRAGEEVELEVEEALELIRATARAGSPTTPRAVSYDGEEPRDAGIGREFRLLACSSETTQFVGVVPPGRARMHNHPYDEVAYVVEGEGVLHWEDGSEVPVGTGSCIFFPRLVFHSLENTGTESLRIMGVIAPAHSPAERVQVLDW
jgi:mannose-6-phosphate isomerase-like protein (cupin superfamily)